MTLTYVGIEPIDLLLSGEQTGFDAEKSTVNLVVLLIQNIEDFLEAKKKAGAIFAAVLFQNWL